MATYSQISPNRIITNDIVLTDSKIIHFIPDFNSSFVDFKNNFPFKLHNIDSIIVKSNIVRFGSISLNPKRYGVELKKSFSKTNFSLPRSIAQNRFIIIDHSPIINVVKSISELSERRALFLLLNYLKNEFQYTKTSFIETEHIALFSFNNNGLFELLSDTLRVFKSRDDLFRFFDNYTLIHASNSITPAIYYKSGNLHIDFQAFNRFESIVKKIDISKPEKTVTPELLDTVDHSQEKIEKEISNTQIPEESLSSEILNRVVGDKIIVNDKIQKNIENVIKTKISKNTSEDEANQIVLKTINKSLFGTDQIKQEYLDNPKLLLSKIEAFDEHSDKLNFNNIENTFISPNSDTIKIEEITGPIRHKHEFGENIHSHVNKLFKTLEGKSTPIDVVDISHEIKDNNVNRYIEYTITLQNKSGGLKQPYDIKLNVPYPINDRYFKLNGKEYILASQQFLIPLTKNTPTEARFLSHFSMITEKLVNFKYSPSDIPSLLEYVTRKYGSLVKKYDKSRNFLEFNDGSIVDLSNGHIPFSHDDLELIHENGKYFIYKENKKIDSPIRKTEFLYEHIFNIINSVNPSDELKNSTRSVQYVEIHVMGPHLPLILALWQQLGLMDAFIKLGIDAEIVDTLPEKSSKKIQVYELRDDKYLIVSPKSKREEYIANGLLKLDFLPNLISADLNDRKSCYEHLVNTYGNKILNNLDNMVENGIDPTTKELLEYYDLPTNIIDIMSGPLLDKLFNDELDHPSDLNTLRVRMSEYMTQLMYTEIDAAVSLHSNM